MSGEYIIEDVEGDSGTTYRRLVFLSNQNVVQSEARLKTGISVNVLCIYTVGVTTILNEIIICISVLVITIN